MINLVKQLFIIKYYIDAHDHNEKLFNEPHIIIIEINKFQKL